MHSIPETDSEFGRNANCSIHKSFILFEGCSPHQRRCKDRQEYSTIDRWSVRAACRAYTSELPPSPPPPPPPPQLEKKAPTGRLLSRRDQVARGEPQPAGRARFKVGNLSRNFSGKATGAAPGAAGRPPPGGPGRAPAQEMAAARPPRAACPKGRPHEPLHGGVELTGSRPAASGGAGHGKPWRAEVSHSGMCDPRRPPVDLQVKVRSTGQKQLV
jgi:hypothetical protein